MGRSFANRLFGGVCGGLAESTPVNAWVLRLLFVLLTLGTLGAGALVYVLWWWLLPQKSPLSRLHSNGGRAFIALVLSVVLIGGWFVRGSLPADDSTALYWALALLVLGIIFFVKQVATRHTDMIVAGLVIVAVPALWSLSLLGLFPVGLVDILLRAAPALLIFIGLWILLRYRLRLGGLLALVISVGLAAGVASYAFSSRATNERTENTIMVEETLGEPITTLQISLWALDTDVRLVAAASSATRTVTAEFVGSENSRIERSYSEDSTLATLELREMAENEFPLLEDVGRGTLQLTVPPDVAVGIALRVANGDINMDMAQTNLERLSFDLMTGDALVTLPVYQPQSANVRENPGVWTVRDGDLRVIVPDELGVRLVLDRQRNAEPTASGNFDPLDFQLAISEDNDDFLLQSRQYDAKRAQVEYIVDVLSGTLRVVTADRATDNSDPAASSDDDTTGDN